MKPKFKFGLHTPASIGDQLWSWSRRVLPAFGLLLLFLLLWEGGVRLFRVPDYLLPPPSQIFGLMGARPDLLLHHTQITMAEVGLGFLFAFVGGILLAITLFCSQSLERAVYPLLIASQNIPVFAIAPLLIVWLGYGLWPKVVVAALIVFFPIVVNTFDGIKAADPDLIHLLQVMGAGRGQILAKVRIPAALPFIFSGTKLGITYSVIGAVIGEWVGSQAGLGYLMLYANRLSQVDLLFAALFVLSLLGVGLFGMVMLLERFLMPWRQVVR